MSDDFVFTMAALNENESFFANPCKGEKNISVLMYRPSKILANNSEWSMRYEEEEVRSVALGTMGFTSLNFLWIFTEGGLQKNVGSLDAPVVTASDFGMNLQRSHIPIIWSLNLMGSSLQLSPNIKGIKCDRVALAVTKYSMYL